MSGQDASGRVLTFEELQPDIDRLLDYAQTMDGPNQSAYRAKLTSEVNVRVQQLRQTRMDLALTAVSKATYDQDANIEAVGQTVGVLATAVQHVQERLEVVRNGQQTHLQFHPQRTRHQQTRRLTQSIHGGDVGNSVWRSC